MSKTKAELEEENKALREEISVLSLWYDLTRRIRTIHDLVKGMEKLEKRVESIHGKLDRRITRLEAKKVTQILTDGE